MANHIHKRSENGIYEYRRRVPKAVAHVVHQTKVKRSLGTTDERIALQRGREIDVELEGAWAALLEGESATTVTERFEAGVRLARAHGFTYRPLQNFSAADIEDLVSRVIAARQIAPAQPLAARAIMGTIEEPQPRLSNLWELYEKHNAAGLQGKSPNQLRKHKTPRGRAISYAQQAMGEDRELGSITRADVLTMRTWWTDKLVADGLKADTVNRSFTDIKGMLTVVDGALQTHYGDVWKDVRIKATNKTKSDKRAVYALDFVQDRVLAPGALDGLNLEAMVSVYLIIETGARPSEICNLRGEDFHLQEEVPFVRIPERDDRELKTEYSVREIPLVGCALWAAKKLLAAQPEGFTRYADREDSLSNLINKYLKNHGLRPTKLHVFYSFRHTFQDRILAADAPDRLQTDLMGHEFDRPVYGEGASLKQKFALLDRIKFRWPDDDAEAGVAVA